jgi:TP901 family phage tail tape measure protein
MNGDLGLGVIVSMKDAFSQNAARVQSSMQSLDATVAASSERMTRNLDRIQKGTMMIGAGLALMAVPVGLIASTAATQKALGEMASLGTKDLRALEDAAENFTNTWAGYSKAEFIGAAYDVKSALAGLSDEAVGTFSAMAALTAKATKASIQEMVGTFTTGYGIFKPIMANMTDMEWAKAFSGAMAQTVAVFKTTGAQMAEAIKNIGAVAASSNIPLHEQLAILGQLQTTMPGSEAGTLYKAFIMKAAEAGEQLGLSFIDSSGRLKGIIPILQEVKSRFPDLSQAAAQVQIKKAFGSDEAVKFLLQMSQGMESLEGNISSIEQAMKSGTAVTEEMAKAMNMDIGSQFQLLRQQVGNLAEILGRTLLPVVTPIIQGISKAVLFFQKLARSMPGLTRVLLTLSMALGAVLVVVGGVIAAAGTIGLMLPAIKAGLAAMGAAIAGVGSTFAAYFLPVVAIIGGVVLAVYLLKRAWETNFAGIRDTILGAWEKVQLVFQGIRALVTSLSGGAGTMSADLAQKLEQAGLMGLVVTVFRIYYRVRQFLTSLWEAFSDAFGKIRAILEPAVRALMQAYGMLYKAIFSVLEIFGLAASSADASSYRSLGETLGTVLGVIAKVGAYLLKFVIYNLAAVITVVAWVVRAVVWLGKTIVTAFIEAGKFIYKFFLPVRLLVEALRMAARVVSAVWQVLTGDISVLDGLKAIGGAVFDFLATPFRWARDVIVGVWDFIKGLFSAVGSFFASAASALAAAFMNLPLVRTLADVFGAVRGFLSGDTTFFEAGKAILVSVGKGIWSAVTYPFEMLKKALGWLRRLLPFSDAETGPLSDLTASGAAVLKTLAKGMLGVLSLPGKVLSLALQGMLNAVRWVWDGLKSLGGGILSAVTWPFRKGAEAASAVWRTVGTAASSAWNGIEHAASRLWTGLVNVGRTAWSLVSTPFSWIAGSAGAAWDRVQTSAGAAWDGIANHLQGGWSRIGSLFQSSWSLLSAPFDWIAGSAASAWSRITGTVSTAWDTIKTMAQSAWEWIKAPFEGLASVALSAWEQVKTAASSAFGSLASSVSALAGSAFESGSAFMTAVGDGIKSAVSAPYQAAKSALSFVRNLLPFSDAKEGPLADLTRSGAALIQTLAGGITKAASAPAEAVTRAFGFMTGLTGKIAAPAMLAGTLALTPVMTAEAPTLASSLESTGAAVPMERPAASLLTGQARLLSETKGALGPESGMPSAPPGETLRPVLESLMAKLEQLGDRPIEVSVTTLLDGRQVARSVYRDLRERKIKNYETL